MPPRVSVRGDHHIGLGRIVYVETDIARQRSTFADAGSQLEWLRVRRLPVNLAQLDINRKLLNTANWRQLDWIKEREHAGTAQQQIQAKLPADLASLIDDQQRFRCAALAQEQLVAAVVPETDVEPAVQKAVASLGMSYTPPFYHTDGLALETYSEGVGLVGGCGGMVDFPQPAGP